MTGRSATGAVWAACLIGLANCPAAEDKPVPETPGKETTDASIQYVPLDAPEGERPHLVDELESGGRYGGIGPAMIHAPLSLSYDKDEETGEETLSIDRLTSDSSPIGTSSSLSSRRWTTRPCFSTRVRSSSSRRSTAASAKPRLLRALADPGSAAIARR